MNINTIKYPIFNLKTVQLTTKEYNKSDKLLKEIKKYFNNSVKLKEQLQTDCFNKKINEETKPQTNTIFQDFCSKLKNKDLIDNKLDKKVEILQLIPKEANKNIHEFAKNVIEKDVNIDKEEFSRLLNVLVNFQDDNFKELTNSLLSKLKDDKHLINYPKYLNGIYAYSESLYDIYGKLENISDDFVKNSINAIILKCKKIVKEPNTEIDKLNEEMLNINEYLDMYHTFNSNYEYYGDKYSIATKRQYMRQFKNNGNSNYKNIKYQKDLKVEPQIDRLRYILKNKPNDKIGNYFYNKYYIKLLPVSIQSKVKYLNNKYDTKLFLSFDSLKNAKLYLKYIDIEFSEWKNKGGEKAKYPILLDLSMINKEYIDNNVAYGMGAANGYHSQDHVIGAQGQLNNIINVLRHEMTHRNDLKNLNDFMQSDFVKKENGKIVANKCKFYNDFIQIGIPEYHIAYAYNNPKEFIAVASEGDLTKCSPEFKQQLINFGMPEWEFNMMPKDILALKIDKNYDYISKLLKNYEVDGTSITLENIPEIFKYFMDIFNKCETKVKLLSHRLHSPYEPKKFFKYCIDNFENYYEIMKDDLLINKILNN